MYWKEYEKDFGRIKENKDVLFTFHALANIPEIDSITAQCGCTKVKYEPKDRTLSVVYKSGFIPNHLENIQEVVKTILVNYKDGVQEVLLIRGVKER